ncbi:MAG: acyltransferase [Arenimonas sp.]
MGGRSQFEHQIYIKATNDKARIKLGEDVFVGFNCEFDISENLTIGNHALIAPGCFITDHNHRHAANKLIAEQGCETAPVILEDDVWLGAHVVVLPGVTIGRGAIVAAGSVVNRSVESMSIVAGVPAREIGRRG